MGMSRALSIDLRVRVLRAVAEGARFSVRVASASRWRALERMQGDPRHSLRRREREVIDHSYGSVRS
jgi:hypothetical protein